jgi:hypothetical protein
MMTEIHVHEPLQLNFEALMIIDRQPSWACMEGEKE